MRLDASAVVHQHALGDLEADALAAERRCARAPPATRSDEVGLRELAGRQVHRHRERRRPRGRSSRHCHQLAARLLEHPRADRHDEPGLLGQVDELVRRDQPALGVLPAHQRLGARRSVAVGERDDRLVEDAELVALERAVQRVLGLEPLRAPTSRISSSNSSQRPLPRSLARYIAASASRSSVSGARRPVRASAMPMLALRAGPRRSSWNGASITSSRRSATSIACGSASSTDEVVAEHGELVAAEAGDGVARPHAARRRVPSCDRAARRRRRGRGCR